MSILSSGKHPHQSWLWWCMPVIPVLGKLRQKDPKFRSGWVTQQDCLNKNKQKAKQKYPTLGHGAEPQSQPASSPSSSFPTSASCFPVTLFPIQAYFALPLTKKQSERLGKGVLTFNSSTYEMEAKDQELKASPGTGAPTRGQGQNQDSPGVFVSTKPNSPVSSSQEDLYSH